VVLGSTASWVRPVATPRCFVFIQLSLLATTCPGSRTGTLFSRYLVAYYSFEGNLGRKKPSVVFSAHDFALRAIYIRVRVTTWLDATSRRINVLEKLISWSSMRSSGKIKSVWLHCLLFFRQKPHTYLYYLLASSAGKPTFATVVNPWM